MSGSDPRIPQERAQAIWRRAARLQAEAERRMEKRTHALAAGESPAEGEGDPDDGFRARDVESAAVEAGISSEFVRIAMAEIASGEPPPPPMRPWEERAARRFLGDAERSLEVTTVVRAPVARTVEAALRVLCAHPCLLRVSEVVEVGSLPGRVVVFGAPRYDWSASSNPPFAEAAAMIGLRRVHLTVRALQDDPRSSEVVVSGDLERGARRSWRLGALTSAAAGAAGAGGGIVVGASAALTGVLLALPAMAGLAVVGGVAAVTWSYTHRYYRARVVEALEETLRSLDAAARAGSGGGDPRRLLLPLPEGE